MVNDVNKTKKILIITLTILLIVSSALAIIIKERTNELTRIAEEKCAEVLFDFICAINKKNINEIDGLVYGKVPIDRDMIYYDKDCVEGNLEVFSWNVIWAEIDEFSYRNDKVRMSLLMTNEDGKQSADSIILKKTNGGWKITEIHGEGIFFRELFKHTKEKIENIEFDPEDISYWEFKSATECDFFADYERLH